MFFGSLKRLGAAAAGVATARLPSHCMAEDCGSAAERKEFFRQRSHDFPLASHWYGKLRVRVMKVRRDNELKHSVSEYTVETRLYSDVYNKCFTDSDNTDVIATDTQKNNVYVVAKRTAASSPEQFGVEIAKHFLNEYPVLNGVEIIVEEHPWERVSIEGQQHDHGFFRASPEQAVATVKLTRGRRWDPQVTSGIRGMTVLKTTQSGWENFLKDRFTVLGDTDDRCMSTQVSCEWTYVKHPDSVEPNYASVRKSIQDQLKLGFFGPARCGVYSTSVQATIYDIGCMVLEKTPNVADITINTPNLHYIPVTLLERIGEKFENDVYLPTSEPSGNIQCTVTREV